MTGAGTMGDEAGFGQIRWLAQTAWTLRSAATSMSGLSTTGVGAQHARRATIAADSPPPNPPEVRQSGILPGRTVRGTGIKPVTSSIGEKCQTSLGGLEMPPYAS